VPPDTRIRLYNPEEDLSEVSSAPPTTQNKSLQV